MTTAAYDELARHWSRLHRFGHVYSIVSWDRAAMMPAKGNEARAQGLAEMDALLHSLRTEPRLAGAARRRGARQPARDPAQLDQFERAAGAAGGGEVARRFALRACLAKPAPGRRLARLSRQPARGRAPCPRGGEAPRRRHRPGAVRRADGP